MFDIKMDNNEYNRSCHMRMKPHAYLNDGLLLRGEVLLYILLQSSQHHGLQNALKFLNLRYPKTQF